MTLIEDLDPEEARHTIDPALNLMEGVRASTGLSTNGFCQQFQPFLRSP